MMWYLDIKCTCRACPVQFEGTFNSTPFYFRARGNWYDIGIGEDPVGLAMGEGEGFHSGGAYYPGDDYAASWMPHEEALRIITEACDAWVAHE